MNTIKQTIKFAMLLLIAVLVWQCQDQTEEVNPAAVSAPNGGPKNQLSPLTLQAASATQVSITIRVTAGATGAPAGFSLQWMTKEAYDAVGGNWDAAGEFLCKGSFSGNASLSRYNLEAGESVLVNVGEFLFDNGASTNCGGALVCGTEYVFRSFAHATSKLQRSAFSPVPYLSASTLACGHDEESCTLTQGYWKNHGPEGCASGNNTNAWPVASLSLGSVEYTDLQLCSNLKTPAAGNGLIALAHQLIAAKLNVANGANASAITATISSADALIGSMVVPPIGSGYLHSSQTSALTDALARYNEGAVGPGHCGN